MKQTAPAPAVTTTAAPATPLPQFGDDSYSITGVRGACDAIALRLPGMAETAPCMRAVGTLLHEEFLLTLDVRHEGPTPFIVDVSEVAQTSEQRNASRQTFALAAQELPSSGPTIRVMRVGDHFVLSIDDGSKIEVRADWVHIDHYDVSNTVSPVRAARLDAPAARLAEFAARTLRLLRPLSASNIVRLPMKRGASLNLTLPANVFTRRLAMVTNAMEIGPELSLECATYGFFVIPEPHWSIGYNDQAVTVGNCRENDASAQATNPRPRFDITHAEQLPADLMTVRTMLEALLAQSTAAPAPSAVGPARSDCRVVVADPHPPMNLRADASTRSATLGTVDNEVAVRVVQRSGNWARVEAPNATGWAHMSNLSERCP